MNAYQFAKADREQRAGYDKRIRGASLNLNPHPDKSAEYGWWKDGWEIADQHIEDEAKDVDTFYE